MIERAAYQLLSETGLETLEKMFFTAPDRVCADSGVPAGDLIAVHLTFQGDPPGGFAVLVTAAVARSLAANFLGLDDATPAQVREVCGELANIVCGAVLSELQSNANFSLSTPIVGLPDSLPACLPISCRFELPAGDIVFSIAFEAAA